LRATSIPPQLPVVEHFPSNRQGQSWAAIYTERDRYKIFGASDIPGLVIHGNENPLIPEPCGGDCAKMVSDFRYKSGAGTGHDLSECLVPD